MALGLPCITASPIADSLRSRGVSVRARLRYPAPILRGNGQLPGRAQRLWRWVGAMTKTRTDTRTGRLLLIYGDREREDQRMGVYTGSCRATYTAPAGRAERRDDRSPSLTSKPAENLEFGQ